MLAYLTVSLDVHLSAQDERLQVDVGLWGDGPSFPRLADHSQPFVETPLVIELSQVRLAVHLDAVLHVGVPTHQALHVTHVKLFQLLRSQWRRIHVLEADGCIHSKSLWLVYMQFHTVTRPAGASS